MRLVCLSPSVWGSQVTKGDRRGVGRSRSGCGNSAVEQNDRPWVRAWAMAFHPVHLRVATGLSHHTGLGKVGSQAPPIFLPSRCRVTAALGALGMPSCAWGEWLSIGSGGVVNSE